MIPVSVSIIIPCRNEVRHIAAVLDSILRQEGAPDDIEVLVADGMSDDGTREVLDRLAAQDDRLRVIDNPRMIVSPGLNAAIRLARGDVIVRMDTHTEYAPDYVARCLDTLEQTGADNVGGPARTKAIGYFQNINSLAYHSPFSVGGARFHDPTFEGWVDTVTYGCWRREVFERFGYFDEELVRNQDDEHNLRIIRGGGRIWQSPAIKSWYHPRSSLTALFRQYAQYGYWKVRVIQKHRLPASLRHLVPGSFIVVLLLLAVLAPFLKLAALLLALLLAAYIGVNLTATLITCSRPENWRYLPVMPLVFAAYHFGYGWGFLRGIVDFVLLRKGAGESFKTLTRQA